MVSRCNSLLLTPLPPPLRPSPPGKPRVRGRGGKEGDASLPIKCLFSRENLAAVTVTLLLVEFLSIHNTLDFP